MPVYCITFFTDTIMYKFTGAKYWDACTYQMNEGKESDPVTIFTNYNMLKIELQWWIRQNRFFLLSGFFSFI